MCVFVVIGIWVLIHLKLSHFPQLLNDNFSQLSTLWVCSKFQQCLVFPIFMYHIFHIIQVWINSQLFANHISNWVKGLGFSFQIWHNTFDVVRHWKEIDYLMYFQIIFQAFQSCKFCKIFNKHVKKHCSLIWLDIHHFYTNNFKISKSRFVSSWHQDVELFLTIM